MIKLNDNAVSYMNRRNFKDIILQVEEITS